MAGLGLVKLPRVTHTVLSLSDHWLYEKAACPSSQYFSLVCISVELNGIKLVWRVSTPRRVAGSAKWLLKAIQNPNHPLKRGDQPYRMVERSRWDHRKFSLDASKQWSSLLFCPPSPPNRHPPPQPDESTHQASVIVQERVLHMCPLLFCSIETSLIHQHLSSATWKPGLPGFPLQACFIPIGSPLLSYRPDFSKQSEHNHLLKTLWCYPKVLQIHLKLMSP